MIHDDDDNARPHKSNVIPIESRRMTPEDFPAPKGSEEALAQSFAQRYENKLKYVATIERWFVWDGRRWQADDKLTVLAFAREQCSLHAEATGDKTANKRTVVNVLSLARADRRLAMTLDQFDADPWLLNTPGGTVDLKTGKQWRHDPKDFCTKLTAVEPQRMLTPRFDRFLDQFTDGNKKLQSYLQRAAGYWLSGQVSEHCFWFFHGTGANGKSVFVNTIGGILGDYHRTAAMETFTASKFEQHPTGLAALMGARFVTASETERGRRWAESRIKQLTGGDPIAPRYCRPWAEGPEPRGDRSSLETEVP
jgi:putative DNA primase/helicase